MSNFIPAAKLSELNATGRLLVEVDDRIVALFRVGGEIFCIDDVCTHDGGPLSDGKLDDHTIACPRHGAKFDIRTGKALTMPATVDTAAHDVKIEGDTIFVRICERGKAAQAANPTNAGPIAGTVLKASGAADVKTEPVTPAVDGGVNLSEDLVREELKKVIDPELFVNIVDLGLIYNVDLVPRDDGKTTVKIDMTMTSPMCPAGPQLIANSKQVVSRLDPVGDVEVKIVLDPPWTPDKMTDEARDQLGIF
ncbi:MAG TPA: Rieske 2Fe-2S domain-containing protein [Pirellulaceae bacterium]|nr:Rieske 2Fe-2S domain-containing protein [Pirellulaceae bacterium]